jgi:hypothetical protein
VRNATASPLLRLPKELLDHIFSYVVEETDVWIGPSPPSAENLRWNPRLKRMLPRLAWFSLDSPSALSFALKLPLVCRQVYHLTILLAYKRFTFQFETKQTMNTWILWSAPAQREVLRSISLPYECAIDVLAGIKEPFTKTFVRLEVLNIICKYRQLQWHEHRMFRDGLAKKEGKNLRIVIDARPGVC